MELIVTIKEWIGALAEQERLWVAHVFAVVLATLLASYVVGFVLRRLGNKADRNNAVWLTVVFKAARSPAKWLVFLLGISWAAHLAHQGSEFDFLGIVDTVRQVGVSLLIAWFMVRCVGLTESEFLTPRKGDPGDPTTVTAVGKLLRAAVIITTALVIAQSLGYSMSGVLAFGGLGGLAVGFAAKDLLANFFGGLMVQMDRPFAVGEWIRSPDRNIEGTVENIGWRLTRIRTFDRRPLYVPNAIFTQVSVENPSRMENRRIYETIGIRYSDADKMAAIVADVKAMIKEHPDLEVEDRILIVNFVTFNKSSLDFFVYTFTKTIDWVQYHEIKQDVMLKILDIIADHEAEIAFPTSTLHVPDPVTLAREAGEDRSEEQADKPTEESERG